MNRLLILYLIILFPVVTIAQGNKYTISDGDWNDPNIWSPIGVPTLSTDSFFVNHSISFSGSKVINGADYVYIGPNGCVYGSTGNDDFAVIALAKFISYGKFNVRSFSIQTNNSEVYGSVNASYIISFFNSTTLHSSSSFNCEYFLNKARMSLDGNIECSYFRSDQFLTGSGKFCVMDSVINNDSIMGSIIISDATPSGIGDDYYGVIGPSVTFNPSAVCSIQNVFCSGMSIEETSLATFKIYPNPSSNFIYIESKSNCYYEIFDLSGKKVKNEMSQNQMIDISSLSPGIYLLSINSIRQRFIKL